jgi:trimeric autotransporter adhesin
MSKIIDIASTLNFVNDYNISGSSGTLITANDAGSLVFFSTVPSSNSSSGTIVLHNGGLSINTTLSATNVSSGGGLTIRGGAAVAGNLVLGSGLCSLSNSNTIGNIYTTGGNIGIGTTNPSFTLDVLGGSIRSSSLTSNDITTSNIVNTSNIRTLGLYASSASSESLETVNSTISSLYVTNALSSLYTNTIGNIYTTGGNVGIGTTAPTRMLDISGTMRVNSGLAAVTSVVVSGSGDNLFQLQNFSVNKSNSLLFLDNSGSDKLTVGYGNNGVGVSALAGVAYIQTNLGVPIKLMTNNQINNPITINANDNSMSINTSTDALDTSSGSLIVSGGIGVAKDAFMGNNVNVRMSLSTTNITAVTGVITGITTTNLTTVNITSTNISNTNISSGTVIASTSLSATGNSNTIGNIFTTSGNVGINITNPLTTLDVNGTIRSTGLTTSNITVTNASVSNINTNVLSTNTANMNILNYGITSVFSGSFAASNNVNVFTDVSGFAINNTTTLSFRSHVNVSINRSIGGSLCEYFALDGHKTDSGWTLYADSVGDISGYIFGITNTGQVQYTSTLTPNWTNAVIRYDVLQLNNTTNTQASLQTSGTVNIDTLQLTNTSNAIYGVNNGSLYVSGGGVFQKNLIVNSTGTLCVVGQNNTIGTLFTSSDSIGIKTTSPIFTLDVNGSGRFVDGLTTGTIVPSTDNVATLGTNTARWATVHAANGVIQTSDSRLKDYKQLTYGLKELQNVDTIQYKWKYQNALNDNDPLKHHEYYGLKAENLQQIFPELVYGVTDDESNENSIPMQVNYNELIPVCINAIKELNDRVTQLQQQLQQQSQQQLQQQSQQQLRQQLQQQSQQ